MKLLSKLFRSSPTPDSPKVRKVANLKPGEYFWYAGEIHRKVTIDKVNVDWVYAPTLEAISSYVEQRIPVQPVMVTFEDRGRKRNRSVLTCLGCNDHFIYQDKLYTFVLRESRDTVRAITMAPPFSFVSFTDYTAVDEICPVMKRKWKWNPFRKYPIEPGHVTYIY